MKRKYIFVTGGVLSALGKGLSSAALGALLESRGLRVTHLKMDPYLNVDPGTMSPYQHGEVFVTDDGAETDLDLGHYERFSSVRMSQRNNFTTGRVYQTILEKERKGEYLGRTVQVIPHVTDEIKRHIHEAAEDADLAIIEVGGTVGDIESLPFLEAIRQFRNDVGEENVLYIHLTLVVYMGAAGELKTKPTQHSVKELLRHGIQPDLLFARCDRPVPRDVKRKIALFCNLQEQDVISVENVDHIYELPAKLHAEGVDDRVCEKLGIWAPRANLDDWDELVARIHRPSHKVRIAIVGKYTHLVDTYMSLNEALRHGGVASDARVELVYLDSEALDVDDPGAALEGVDGVLVPGGFGVRGTEGKIAAIRWARETGTPFFGICLGLQMAVVEYCRNVLGLRGAMSREFDPDPAHPVIEMMNEQREVTQLGGTMRLGTYPCVLDDGSLARRIYGGEQIDERHRHRYEVNPAYHEHLRDGLVISGWSPDRKLAEIVELRDHPWFLGCQFHPEFKSRPLEPHPLFASFVKACVVSAAAKSDDADKVVAAGASA
ncbi:MAG: CTP synthase [Alphaproteobacteria bacterium]|nr:CTP synthase [Alphaproteobacteria bacterium]